MSKKELPAGKYRGLFGQPTVKVDAEVKRPRGRPPKLTGQPPTQGTASGAGGSGIGTLVSGTQTAARAVNAPVPEEQNAAADIDVPDVLVDAHTAPAVVPQPLAAGPDGQTTLQREQAAGERDAAEHVTIISSSSSDDDGPTLKEVRCIGCCLVALPALACTLERFQAQSSL